MTSVRHSHEGNNENQWTLLFAGPISDGSRAHVAVSIPAELFVSEIRSVRSRTSEHIHVRFILRFLLQSVCEEREAIAGGAFARKVEQCKKKFETSCRINLKFIFCTQRCCVIVKYYCTRILTFLLRLGGGVRMFAIFAKTKFPSFDHPNYRARGVVCIRCSSPVKNLFSSDWVLAREIIDVIDRIIMQRFASNIEID